jgi:hypothetical protein
MGNWRHIMDWHHYCAGNWCGHPQIDLAHPPTQQVIVVVAVLL